MHRLTLHLLPDEYAVCRLDPGEPVPDWAARGAFVSVTRTGGELSILCPAAAVPAGVKQERDWRLLRFAGPFAFTETGVLASVLGPLATAGVSILAQSTHDTDYVLVRGARLADAVATLRNAGHTVRPA